MTFLTNIGTVSHYEAKILRRSWFFRLFSLGALFILTIMNIGVFSPVGDEDWDLVANPSSLPLINLYLLNIGQAIVVIFLAADFLKRDKKVDTNEVLYTRSMSNLEYVLGKTSGILRLFLGLDLIILGIGLVINIISKKMEVDILAYFWYLLIISVPTILFSLGLAFMLMSLIRNQAVTFLILLGIAALDMFWLWHRGGSVFDYMAFGLPVFKSSVVGFENPQHLFNQRGIFFFAGIALVLMTVLMFKRLPQSKYHNSVAGILMTVSLVFAAYCAYNTYSEFRSGIKEKENIISANKKFEDHRFVRVSEADIEISHNLDMIKGVADLRFINDGEETISSYIFSLNPGLVVDNVKSGGIDLKFSRINHLVEITPISPLQEGMTDSLVIEYSGYIKESFCYPDYEDNIKESPYRIAMVNVRKRQTFVTEKYVLLTPDAHWYPVAGLNYYPSNPARIKVDFTSYKLRVKSETDLIPVSQGERTDEDGFFTFRPGLPLTGITLAMGNYLSDTIRVDSVNYISHYFPGHDYYKKDLNEIGDTLHLLISGIMRELETNFSTRYPFNSLHLVEVPVQFYSYPRMNTQTRAEVQPSMVLLPERLSTLQNTGFEKQFTRQKRRMERNNQVITDKELQVRLFMSFIRNTFISGQNFRYINGVALNEPTRFRLGPSFYFFKNNFFSSEYPVINSVFESHLQKIEQPQGGEMMMTGNISENDKANLILRNASFRDVLAMNPGSDTVRSVITVKGDYLFSLLRANAGIDEFNNWFIKYLDEHKFTSIDIAVLNKDIKEHFGFEFYNYLNNWFNVKELPGFLFSDVRATEVVIDDRVRYMVSFTVSNPEPVAGIFTVSFRTGGPGGGPRGGGMGPGTMGPPPGAGGGAVAMIGRGLQSTDISKVIVTGPAESRRISIILDAQPRALQINTLASINLPGEIIFPIDEITKSKSRSVPLEANEVITNLPPSQEEGEIIVDNEDPGFDRGNHATMSPLKRLLGVKSRQNDTYGEINYFYSPEFWQPVIQTNYYGKYIRSAVVTRPGKEDRRVKWTTVIDEPGYYDIYCYIGKARSANFVIGMRNAGAPPPPQGNQQRENQLKDMHYYVFHDEGSDEISVDFQSADPGWFNLGRYYLSADTAKVELSNESTGRTVIGDAVKWVKVN